LLGVELVRDRDSKEPAGDEAAMIHEQARDRGLLFGRGGLYGNVLRIKPPMCITRQDVDFLGDVLDETFSAVAR
jgi:alanine-glyoxylate transaminase/(R)-3-amino-2-methylpropionate-pyruvate transaminase